ncbi:DoxX family protein [Acerihabitans sp. KWT182]|uniref:DoxX family protein n=1 Tax=Acerihabitans sp. KWT182 TaxID=3157919 RepID=A0AAU7QES2_9GAMM
MATIAKTTDDRFYSKPTRVPNSLVSVLIALTLLTALYCGFFTKQLPDFSAYTATLLLLLSLVISIWVTPKNFTVGFLTSLLPYMIGWRIGAMLNIGLIMTVAPFAFAAFVGQFIDCIHNDWTHDKADGWFGNMQWQMTLVRLYFGFNWTGHFTEKLFAGQGSFNHLVQVFYNYGLTGHTAFFVILGGLVELSIAIGVGMGFLTRLAGFGGLAYVLVANFFGGHIFNGYTWNSKPNGGWEYILLLVVFFGSFMLSGAGKFSIDGWLISRGLMPKFLLPLCVTRAGR